MSAQLLIDFEPPIKVRKRHAVRQTSRAAYDQLRTNGTVCYQAQTIRDWVARRGSPASLQEISRGMNLPINVVSGRVNDCKKVDLLFEHPKRACSVTGNTVTPVYIEAFKEGTREP